MIKETVLLKATQMAKGDNGLQAQDSLTPSFPIHCDLILPLSHLSILMRNRNSDTC